MREFDIVLAVGQEDKAADDMSNLRLTSSNHLLRRL